MHKRQRGAPVKAEEGSRVTRSSVIAPMVMFCTCACKVSREKGGIKNLHTKIRLFLAPHLKVDVLGLCIVELGLHV